VQSPPHRGEEPKVALVGDVIALTLNQVCATLQLSRPSAVRLIESGHLHAVKVGRKWLVSTSSVQRFIDGEAS
jgi:excisionase family DNA binding protein